MLVCLRLCHIITIIFFFFRLIWLWQFQPFRYFGETTLFTLFHFNFCCEETPVSRQLSSVVLPKKFSASVEQLPTSYCN